jgi:bifunctional enzyme CysN/CysC
VRALLDLDTLTDLPAPWLRTNDIAAVTIALARPAALDIFRDHPKTGAFVLVDAATGGTVAGGVIDRVSDNDAVRGKGFKLTRVRLLAGLCADLGNGPEAETELRRRAHEVSLILAAAGVGVDLVDLSVEEGL